MFWTQRSPVSSELRGWIADNFAWSIEHRPNWSATPLVLPTRAFFTAPSGDGHEVAEAVLADLQRLLGVGHERISLYRRPMLPDGVSHEYGKLSSVAGTYINDSGAAEISYDPRLMRQPVAFIAIMVHELMHHILAPVVDELPGGEATHELATDLHAIIAGFGVIQLHGAHQAGWLGYMTLESRAYALALFLRLTGTDEHKALSRLDGRQSKALRTALCDLDRGSDELDGLRALLAGKTSASAPSEAP